MPKHRAFALSIAFVSALVLAAQPALAQETTPPPTTPVEQQPTPEQNLAVGNPNHNTEVSFFIGGLVGGDIGTLLTDGFSLSSTLENGRTYGGRVGYYTFPFGVEGSFAYSNSGLGFTAGINDIDVTLGARVMYFEANALLIIIPGPVQPFVTAGGGMHSYEFHDLAGIDVMKLGWNFGGGLKINIKRVTLRADVRDHITSISAADLNIDQELADLLDIGTQKLHNVEISFGFGVRF
jgi:opacity protein-like surface antigen